MTSHSSTARWHPEPPRANCGPDLLLVDVPKHVHLSHVLWPFHVTFGSLVFTAVQCSEKLGLSTFDFILAHLCFTWACMDVLRRAIPP